MTIYYRTKDGEHKIVDAEYIEITDADTEEIHDGVRIMKSDTYSVEVTDNQSTEEFVRVVRCKDCRHNYNTCLNHGVNEPMCYFTEYRLNEDDYCSRGEKR